MLPKMKESVRIRLKALKNGNFSIYLDTYCEGRRFYEFLRLYIVPETDGAARRQNRDVMQQANLMKARRVIELATGQYGARQKRREACRLEEYLGQYEERLSLTHRGESFRAMCQNMENYLRAFLGRKMETMMVGDINTGTCRRFAEYLKQAQMSTGKGLSAVSTYHYFTAFRSMLAEAVRDGLLGEDPTKRMRKQELPKRPAVSKNYLDADEVALLATTACRNESVKRAFIFSCLTGLRLSDVRSLRWGSIRHEGDSWRFSIIMQKTQEPLQEKLSAEAVSWLPARGADDELLFPLPCRSTVARILREWARDAGIGKHVTFHTARHSYATMALTAGADLYTISKLLGHHNIKTTTVYAAVVDAQRDAAVDSVSDLLRKRLKGRRK